MFFCKKCNYTFDISKVIDTEVNEDTRIVLKRASDAFKKLELNEDLSLYKASFKADDLSKNIKYSKLSNEKKQLLNKLFEELTSTGVEFKCTNCNERENINETILLYKYDINTNIDKIKSLEENKLICKNPILPRTCDYICKNLECPTNDKKKNIGKEAIFFRENNSYKVTYLCCVCFL